LVSTSGQVKVTSMSTASSSQKSAEARMRLSNPTDHRDRAWRLFVALAALILGLPNSAAADGFKVGSGRLQTSLEAETHHVVNPGYLYDHPPKDVYFVVRPKAVLELPSDALALKLSADFEYRKYMGLDLPGTANLSTMAGHLGGSLHVNKDGAVGLRVNELFTRQADTGNETSSFLLLHLTNDLGVGLDYRPGGGALVVTADYSLWYDHYDRNQQALVSPGALDNLSHRPSLRFTWKFLPRTGLFVEGLGILTSYPGGSYNAFGLRVAKNPSTNLLLVYAGLVGAVTSRINALLKVGYGDTFSTDRYRSVAGQAELEYLLSDSGRMRLGYQRTVTPTSFFSWVAIDRTYLTATQLLWGSTEISLSLEYSHLYYGLGVIAPSRRTDDAVTGSFGVEHHFRGWLSLALFERLDRRMSAWRAPNGTKVGYLQNDVFLRVIFVVDELAATLQR
jgi:hypothetical protein